jgi:hypothetical protein
MAQTNRVTRRTAVRTAGTALAASAAVAAGLAAQSAEASQRANSLVGTWIITSTRAGSVPNGILVTVLPDGGFLRTGNAHPTESPAMGAWQQGSDGAYEVTYMALQFDNTGAFIGHRKSWLRIPLDPSGDSFTGQFRVVTIDLNGTQSAPTDGEIRGTRMVAEPFPQG